MITEDVLSERLESIRLRMRQAALRSSRTEEDVVLLPATKKQSPEVLRVAMACGLDRFGENRVQEAVIKKAELPASVQWDFIGALQRNKVKDVVGSFSLVHSVDTLALAEEINQRADRAGCIQKILLEVNVGGESSKHGMAPEDVPDIAQQINQLERVEIHGLMTVAPFREDSEVVRPFFKILRNCRDHLENDLGFGLPILSMGMSHDFEVAIEEGSTLVRIGTALFGERN
ncbi:MAG: YggS family pyridoxal phosphate-dependent enzyme [Candidatus Methylacidiphilales bacterium]